MIQTVDLFLAGMTVFAQVVTAVLIFAWFSKNQKIIKLTQKFAVKIILLIALTATLGSLFYSDIAGYTPCKLCWYQRILMYPQVLLVGIALFLKDKKVVFYTLGLSLVGAVIAAYHYAIQLGLSPLTPCSSVGYSVSCAEKFVMQFGYITIPMMSFSAFVLIAVLSLYSLRQTRME